MTKIVLDAGHWLYESGRRCLKKFDANETREWELNKRIVEKVQAKLKDYENVEVLRVDDPTGKTFIDVDVRARKANEFKADIYCSFHHNAGVGGGTGGGITVLTYDGRAELANLRMKLYDSLINAGGIKGNRSQPLQNRSDLCVLRTTKMEAVLVEHGFMDSSTDVPIIITDEYAEKMANGWIAFFEKYLGIKKKATATVKPTPLVKVESANKPDIIYAVKTNGKWLPEVKNTEDYAGVENKSVTDVMIKLSDGTPIKYRVHVKNGNWLPWVTGYNKNDHNNGYAGNGKVIDAIEIKCDKYEIGYKVSSTTNGARYYSEVKDSQNDYAGVFGRAIDKIMCRVL